MAGLLYSMNNRDYDYNLFEEDADKGLYDYIGKLSNGHKHLNDYVNAYRTLMEGIKNKTLVWDKGLYIDTSGQGITNAEKDKEDYYGKMANYIYKVQRRQKEYKEPTLAETRMLYKDASTLGYLFMKHLFGTDKPNLLDFLEIDPFDEKTGKRGVTGRLKTITNTAQYIQSHLDDLLYDLPEAKRNDVVLSLLNFIDKVSDGVINPGDLYEMGRSLGGLIKWDTLLKTDKLLQTPESTEALLQALEKKNRSLRFIDYMNVKYPRATGPLFNYVVKGESIPDNKKLLNAQYIQYFRDQTSETLTKQIRNYLKDQSKQIANNYSNNLALYNMVKIIGEKNGLSLLDENGNYVLNDSIDDTRSTILTWNDNTKTIKEVSMYDIPAFRKKMAAEASAYIDGDESGLSVYSEFLPFYKKGGIMKFHDGNKVGAVKTNTGHNKFSIVRQNADYIRLQILKNPTYWRLVNELQGDYAKLRQGYDEWGKTHKIDEEAWSDQMDTVKAYQDRFKNGLYYNEFKDNIGFNNYGIKHAANENWYEISAGANTGDYINNSWNADGHYSAITNDRTLLGYKGDFTDKELTELKNFYNSNGLTFDIIEDKDGAYRLQPKVKGSLKGEPDGNGGILTTSVIPRKEKNKDNYNVNPLILVLPELTKVGLYLDTVRSNNKRLNTLLPTIKPNLHTTFEDHSAIRGANWSKQLAEKAGGEYFDSFNLLGLTDSNKILVSLLKAQNNTVNVQTQAGLQDNKAIAASEQAAATKQLGNITRRTELFNQNLDKINLGNRERAQAITSNNKLNFAGLTNLLNSLYNSMNTHLTNYVNSNVQNELDLATLEYQNAYNKLSEGIEAHIAAGGTKSTYPKYREYKNQLQNLLRLYKADTSRIQSKYHFYNYQNPILSHDYEDFDTDE